MMIIKILYTSLFILCFNFIKAQEIQPNGKNSFVVVMPDGSYENFNAKNKVHEKAMKLYKEKEAKQKKLEKEQAAAAKKEKEKALALEKKKAKANQEKLKKEQDNKLALEKKKQNKEKPKKEVTATNPIEKDKKTTDKESKNKKEIAEKPKKEESNAKKKTSDKTKNNTKEKDTKVATKSKDNKVKEQPKLENTVVVKDIPSDLKFNKSQKLAPEKDVMLNPPLPPCASITETIDDFTKKKRRISTSTLLFQYTDESMRKYYEGEDFMTCYASMSSLETGYKYINLDFNLASDNVATSYGWLEKDNHLIIKFLDGTTLTLFNSKTDRGTIDNVNRITTYKGIFPIGSGEEKLLSKGEVDAIRVAWSTGTEDYEIYDVDFFSNLLKCFKEN